MPSGSKDSLSEAARSLYTRVAFYYHRRGLTQGEIAQNLQISRQRVNRILSACLDLGIVQIRINSEDSNFLELEAWLEQQYNLNAVRIAAGVTPENIYTEVGLHAGRYLAEVVRDGDIIGFSRGRTLSGMVSHMPAINHRDLVAVQLMGGWNKRQDNVSGDDIVRDFSEKAPVARTVMLYAPVLLRDKNLHDTIVNEPYFTEAYKVIKSCNIAVLGIGRVGKDALLPAVYESDNDFRLPDGAVGEVCAQFYDIHGQPVVGEINEHIITIQYEDLMNIPLRIGVAGQVSKLPAILGAVRGGYVNVLVTDAETALAMKQTD